jgi:hypothetical protein
MFQFSMDRKDVQGVSSQELMRAGMFEDDEFGQSVIEAFKAEHPDWSTEGSESSFGLELLWEESYFTAKDSNPKSVEEALAFIRKVFFFPPINLWLNGRKIDLSNIVTENFIRVSE